MNFVKYEAEMGNAAGAVLSPSGSFDVNEGTAAKKKLKRWQKAVLIFFSFIITLWIGLQLWMSTAEWNIRWSAGYAKLNITEIIEKPVLSEEDYHTLLMQTGLGKPSVDYLLEHGDKSDFLQLQKNFFSEPTVFCDKNTPVSAEEMVTDGRGNKIPGTKIIGLEDGDILITSCCHTFGWRNGHAALVVDAENHTALESVVMGTDSCLQDTSKWESFPAFMVFRLKGVSPEEREEIVENAVEKLNGIPYGLTVGLFSDKFSQEEVTATHCAHLVWQAYRMFGFDLDSNGGPIVTPQDLSKSPLLELKQVYGMDPEVLWQ